MWVVRMRIITTIVRQPTDQGSFSVRSVKKAYSGALASKEKRYFMKEALCVNVNTMVMSR